MKRFRLPPLSRGWKVIRNLALTAALLVFVWGLTDFYINDPHLSFRRAEKANWAGPSEIQGTFISRTDHWVVGTYRDKVLFHKNDQYGFECWFRNGEEPALIPVPGHEMYLWVVAVDVPEGTTSAQMELETSCYYSEEVYKNGARRQFSANPTPSGGEWRYGQPKRWDKTYLLQGEMLEEGGVLFRIDDDEKSMGQVERYVLENGVSWSAFKTPVETRGVNCTMTAVFFDDAGKEVGRAELRSPD